MRPQKVTLNAVGYSQWIPIDYISTWFGVTLACIPSEDANLTYSAQLTLDTPYQEGLSNATNVSISRSTTTATVTDPGPDNLGHGLSAGDSVIVNGTGSKYLDSPAAPYGIGDPGVTVLSGGLTSTAWTYTVSNAGPTADVGTTQLKRLRVFSHATLAAQTTRQNGSINYPVQAVRLYVSAYSAGFVDMIVLQGMQR